MRDVPEDLILSLSKDEVRARTERSSPLLISLAFFARESMTVDNSAATSGLRQDRPGQH